MIPEDYIDSMGHMNVAWYVRLFARGSRTIFHELGMKREYLETHRAGFFMLETHINYLSEVRSGHHVTIRTRFIDRSATRFQLLHFMSNDTKGTLAATYEVVIAHIDMKVRRMAPIPDTIGANLDAKIQEHRALDWAPPLCGVMKP